MKHTTEQLLLAAEVRRLAFAMRSAATPEHLEGEALAQWRKTQPMGNWLMHAMQEIEHTASVIFRQQD